MATINVGSVITADGKFKHIPYIPEMEDALVCGTPVAYSTNEWKDKRVVVVAVPGAYTPTCHQKHLPPYLEKYEEFKALGVEVIAVIAANDPHVMNGWARSQGLKDKILALSDLGAAWSSTLGLSVPDSQIGWSTRTHRYALIIDNLVVKYIGVESKPGVTVSGAEAVLEKLRHLYGH